MLHCINILISQENNIKNTISKSLKITKGVIRICKSKKDRQHNGQKKKGQTTIYKALHIKLKIKYHEPHQIPAANSGATDG
jgi:3-methyladenine DNA glycosylase Mpg